MKTSTTPTTGSTDGHTPRTDALSATVQNQNWGFRDMQILAQKLESELTTLRRINAALVEALSFYANPETYHAISFLIDPPCGNFMDDFDDKHGDPNYNSKPGKLARETLAAFALAGKEQSV